MKGTILVTGSIGTVGSEVVKQIASSSLGYGVIKVTVHSQDKAHKFKGYDSVEIVNLDYGRKETITDALNNVDKIFLLTLPAPDMTEIYSNLVTFLLQILLRLLSFLIHLAFQQCVY